MAAFRDPGALNPFLAGTLGGVLAMWMTFVPSFLWIFLGGPYVESLRANKRLGAALTAITAAVVGVIANLALWFALHTFFHEISVQHFGPVTLAIPNWRSLDLPALVLGLLAMLAIFRLRLGMFVTLAGASLLGAAYFILAGHI